MNDSDYMMGGFDEMAKSDIQGGRISWVDTTGKTRTVTSNAGVFQTRNELVGAGWTTRVMSAVTVRRKDLKGYVFKSGTSVSVCDITNKARKCMVDTVRELGPLVILDVVDENEGA